MSKSHAQPKVHAKHVPAKRARSEKQQDLLHKRRSFGATEKILRRNAQTWRRAFSKEGRRLDKDAIRAEEET